MPFRLNDSSHNRRPARKPFWANALACLFELGQPQCKTRFLAAGVIRVQHAGFCGFVESRADGAQGGGSLYFLTRRGQSEKCLLQRFEAGLDALIVEMSAFAAAHAVLG